MSSAFHSLSIFEAIRSTFFGHKGIFTPVGLDKFVNDKHVNDALEAYYHNVCIIHQTLDGEPWQTLRYESLTGCVTVTMMVNPNPVLGFIHRIFPMLKRKEQYIEVKISHRWGWRLSVTSSLGISLEAMQTYRNLRTICDVHNGEMIHRNEKLLAMKNILTSVAVGELVVAKDSTHFLYMMEQLIP